MKFELRKYRWSIALLIALAVIFVPVLMQYREQALVLSEGFRVKKIPHQPTLISHPSVDIDKKINAYIARQHLKGQD